MKKLILFLLCLSLISTPTLSKELFNDWLFEYSVKNISNNQVYTQSTLKDEIIIVAFNENNLRITNGTCKTINVYEVCVDDFKIKKSPTVNSKQYKVRINKYIGNLSVKKELAKNNSYLKEENTLKITLTNIGQYIAKDITYKESFPEIILKSSDKDCLAENSDIMINLSMLSETEEKECTFNLYPKKDLNIKTTGKLNYFNGEANITLDSPETEISILPFEFISFFNISNMNPKLEENITLNITLKNEDDFKKNLNNLKLSLGENYIIYESNEWKEKDGYLTLNKEISKKRTQHYNITFAYLNSGTQTIKFKNTQSISLNPDAINFKPLNLNISIHTPIITFQDKNPTLIAGSNFTIPLTISNKGNYNFTNIKLEIINSHLNCTTEEERLDQNTTQEIICSKGIVPNSEDNLNLTINLYFTTPFNQNLKKTTYKTINITHDTKPTNNNNGDINFQNQKETSKFAYKGINSMVKYIIVILAIGVIGIGILLRYFYIKSRNYQ